MCCIDNALLRKPWRALAALPGGEWPQKKRSSVETDDL